MKEYWLAVKLLSAHSHDYSSLSLISSCVTVRKLFNIYSRVVIEHWKPSDDTCFMSGHTADLRQFDCSSLLQK